MDKFMAPLNIVYKDLQVSIFNDTGYNPGSVDNSISYNHVYYNKDYNGYPYLTKYGIIVYRNEELLNAALVMGSGME